MPKADLLKNNSNLLILLGKLILLIGLPLVIFILPYNLIFEGPTVCVFKNFTGNDCFGCGMTRAIFLVLKGQIISAVLLNWRVSIVLPILVLLWYRQMNYTLNNLLAPAHQRGFLFVGQYCVNSVMKCLWFK
jgi:hypothetical protein